MRFFAAAVPATGDVRLVADDGAEWRGTLPGMVAELGRVAKTMRREHLRVWVRGMDDAARRCVAEGVELGAGDLSDARLARAIAQAVEVFGLSRSPAPAEVFNRAFLPDRAARTLPTIRS